MKMFYKSCPLVCLAVFAFVTCLFAGVQVQAATRYLYKIKVYHYKTQAQEDRLDAYFKDAYLPAMHRAGVKNVGVFKVIKQDSLDKKIYVFAPYKTFDELESVDQKLTNDKQYVAAGKDYLEAASANTPYARIETIILRAMTGAPEPETPKLTGPKKDRVYELRSYEGATEALHLNKLKMFNDGDEMGIFKRLNFNAVFYGAVVAGSKMPNLMYMTTFNNQQENTDKWKVFMSDPQFSALSKDPQYKGNVSKNERVYLYPTDYSDY
ncbi:NIPSNAP family protein [Mucilaginibacter auburnensis]|uniref:NIPSNAP protein n=1 Tax=Mucilaginibacter auburnensis TaxID=1457233 RepID=A0A2H9VV58_9SPHI|nr:NIPSNAP family protein [Mucilaginibacter auburnensis]PJJ84714.1 NIPSNAP protein [Mucilaginibacter auburnensis]